MEMVSYIDIVQIKSNYNEQSMMAAVSIRRKGKEVLALALSPSRLINTSAFTTYTSTSTSAKRVILLKLTSFVPPSPIFLRNQSTSASRRSETSAIVDVDYEWLKQSRPVRIHARAVETRSVSSGMTKIIHFQRHGQGVHNEIYNQFVEQAGKPLDLSDMNPENNPLLLPNVIDAPLTDKGIAQCVEQRAAISRRNCGAQLDTVELIISSPLVRCLQTAHITFEDFLPYHNNAIESSREVKWIAHDGIREELGSLLCNKRGPFSETKERFPRVDYTHVSHHGEHDEMWDNFVMNNSNEDGMPKRETIEGMSHRVYDFFVNFLLKRPEKEIVVVGHSHLFLAMTRAVLDVHENDEHFISPVFGQAELRSMELSFTEQ